MISAVYDPSSRSLMIYVKGASEVVLQQCTKLIDKDGRVRAVEEGEH